MRLYLGLFCTRLALVAAAVLPIAPRASAQCEPEWLAAPAGLPPLGPDVFALKSWDPDGLGPERELLVLGGGFLAPANGLSQGVCAWDGRWWVGFGTGVHFPAVRSLWPQNGSLIAGGDFHRAGKIWTNDIASWDGGQWVADPAAFPNSSSGWIAALCAYRGDLIAAGGFDSTPPGGVRYRNIARWDGTTWHPLGSGTNNIVYALAVYRDELYVGGQFVGAGGDNSIWYLGKWNGKAWSQGAPRLTSTNVPLTSVRAITVWNDNLVIAGNFSSINFVNDYFCVARWDGETWAKFGRGLRSVVYALAEYRGELIAAGDFPYTGAGTTVNGIARWDGIEWQPLGSGFGGLFPRCRTLTTYRGQLIAGGQFTTAGGLSNPGWARWGCPFVLGDMNCDGFVTVADIGGFVLSLTDPAGYAAQFETCDIRQADINDDGFVTVADIGPFVALLTQ